MAASHGAARGSEVEGQRLGDSYHLEPRPEQDTSSQFRDENAAAAIRANNSPSEALDQYYSELDHRRLLENAAAAARGAVAKDLKKLESLRQTSSKRILRHAETPRSGNTTEMCFWQTRRTP